MLASGTLLVSLAVNAWIIIGAGLGAEPGPEEIAAFLTENRLALAIVGLLIIGAALFFVLLLRGIYSWLAGSGLARVGVAVGALGAVSVAIFGSGALLDYVPPEWIVSRAADAFLGLAFLTLGIAMLRHRSRSGWASIAMGVLLTVAGMGPVADPHLAQLFVIVWSTVFGLRLVRSARSAAATTES